MPAREPPWDDLKVAFSVDDGYAVWEKLFGSQSPSLPEGWEPNEMDPAGARCVIVFRVCGELTDETGRRVRAMLDALEKSC